MTRGKQRFKTKSIYNNSNIHHVLFKGSGYDFGLNNKGYFGKATLPLVQKI